MRAQPRRGVMRCVVAVAAAIVVAAPAAQSRDARIDAATRASVSLFEQWLGPAPAPAQPPIATSTPADPPATMGLEAAVAFEIARRYWPHQPPTLLMDGAARYLQSIAVARMFDRAFGRAGSGVDAVGLFGGSHIRPITQLRADGPAAGLGRDDFDAPVTRAALAFASLERIVGQPRLSGALRTVIEAAPASDADVIRGLEDALGQDVGWLFDSALDVSKAMNYRIVNVSADPCAAGNCERVRVEVAHDGEARFNGIEVRVDFDDGQSVSAHWDGRGASKTFVFEGPSRPIRVRVDPDFVNLLDENFLDQSREIGATTNVPVFKWMTRWGVWLQDAMLTYSALV